MNVLNGRGYPRFRRIYSQYPFETRDRPYSGDIPNHFAEDSLGHPDECRDLHNHPPRRRRRGRTLGWLRRSFARGSVGQGILAILALAVIALGTLAGIWALANLVIIAFN